MVKWKKSGTWAWVEYTLNKSILHVHPPLHQVGYPVGKYQEK